MPRTLSAATVVLTLLALVLPALPATGAELAGVTLADSAKAGDHNLVLNGIGLRKKLFIKVYVAGFYLPAKSGDAAAILAADEPRQMVMEFVRSVSKDQLCGGWNEGLENNTPNASAELKQQFSELCGYMSDVKEKDRLVFTYLPDSGTEVQVAGSSRGKLAGKAFADALFACWIGPTPPTEEFKAGVLGH